MLTTHTAGMSACNHQIHAKNMSMLSVTYVTSRDLYTIYGTYRDLPLRHDIPRGMFSPCYLRAPSDCTLTFPLCCNSEQRVYATCLVPLH